MLPINPRQRLWLPALLAAFGVVLLLFWQGHRLTTSHVAPVGPIASLIWPSSPSEVVSVSHDDTSPAASPSATAGLPEEASTVVAGGPPPSPEPSDEAGHGDWQPPHEPEPTKSVAEIPPDQHNASNTTEPDVAAYVRAIMDPNDESLPRLSCVKTLGLRYHSLSQTTNSTEQGKLQFFFALDLFEIQSQLPNLMGAVVHVMRYLGPERCALSIVEGRSTDATYAILAAMREHVEHLGAAFYLTQSEINPTDGKKDRMAALADLRNEALAPLVNEPHRYASDADVVFLNDVSICAHDILELMFQHRKQEAHMTCGMDWSEKGEIFYDIYVARSIVGETFWQIAQDGMWHFAQTLFWADLKTKDKFERHQPFQVYACWNGGAVITATPIREGAIRFRGSRADEDECYMGEPTLFCKDLWRLHLNRIQVVPTINLSYGDEDTEEVKNRRGRVEDYVDTGSEELQAEMVSWQVEPPSLVKCMREFAHPYWVAST